MGRPLKKAPDHRCHGTAVLRDVAPGKVPYSVADGLVIDLDAPLVAVMETVARERGKTFAGEFNIALLYAIEKGFLNELGQ